MLISVSLALLAGASLTTAYAQQPSIDEVRNAWKARQERISSAKFIWSVKEFVAEGSKPRLRPAGGGIERLPEDDVTVKRSLELLVSGSKMRYSYQGQIYNPHKGGIRLTRYISVFDGTISKNFFHTMDGDQTDFPLSGFIRKESVHWDNQNHTISPLLMACRPCDETLGGTDLQDYEVSEETTEIGGNRCWLLQPKEPSENGYQRSYWIDPRRDYVVPRITSARGGFAPIWTIDIAYTQPESNPAEWLPESWKLDSLGGKDRRIVGSEIAIFTAFALDESIADSAFELEYPPDTAVVDGRDGQRHIAKEKGGTRIVTHDELARGATYLDLIATESGKALAGQGGSFRKWLRSWNVSFQRFWLSVGPKLGLGG